MKDYATLERAFAAALTARPGDAADVGAFAGPAERSRARFALYRGNVQANLRKALAAAYPVCAALVGEAFFDGLAFEYAARVPAQSGDLNAYGETFADFLDAFDPVRAQVPYLPDIATLEWRVHVAHYAADAAPFDAAVLAGVGPASLSQTRLVLAPATSLVTSRWPVASVWRAHHGDGRLGAIDVGAGGERALVFRPRWRVEVATLDAAEHMFLAAVADGATFGTAVERAHAASPDFALADALGRWIEGGVFLGIAVPGR